MSAKTIVAPAQDNPATMTDLRSNAVPCERTVRSRCQVTTAANIPNGSISPAKNPRVITPMASATAASSNHAGRTLTLLQRNSRQADNVAQNSPAASDITTIEDRSRVPHRATISPAATPLLVSPCLASPRPAWPTSMAIQYASGAMAAPATALASWAPNCACVTSMNNAASNGYPSGQ